MQQASGEARVQNKGSRTEIDAKSWASMKPLSSASNI